MSAGDALYSMDVRSSNRAPHRHSCLVLGDARLAETLAGRLSDLDIRLVRRPSDLRDAVANGGRHLIVVSIPPATLSTGAEGEPANGTELRVVFRDPAGGEDAAAVVPGEEAATRLGIGRRLVFDLQARDLVRDGETIHLRPKEFELLALFTAHPRRAFSRQELLAGVWRREAGRLRTVDVHVHWLRSKIEADPAMPRLLRTVPGFGYRYDPPGWETAANELLTTGS
jgi:DNA-binding winged helix-turn-helix (wHTH) protein